MACHVRGILIATLTLILTPKTLSFCSTPTYAGSRPSKVGSPSTSTPEGFHRLLIDVTSGVEGSTQCDLDESKLRIVTILDLTFLIHVIFVVLIMFLTYALVYWSVGGRRLKSYEVLPAYRINERRLESLSATTADSSASSPTTVATASECMDFLLHFSFEGAFVDFCWRWEN